MILICDMLFVGQSIKQKEVEIIGLIQNFQIFSPRSALKPVHSYWSVNTCACKNLLQSQLRLKSAETHFLLTVKDATDLDSLYYFNLENAAKIVFIKINQALFRRKSKYSLCSLLVCRNSAFLSHDVTPLLRLVPAANYRSKLTLSLK